MFNKRQIIEKIEELGLKDYIVYTGGSLVMHGLRDEATDLDIGVYPKDFERLRGAQEVTNAPFTGERMFRLGDVEIFEFRIHRVPTKEVDGVTVQALRSVYAWKMQMNRPKDRDDMLLIAEFLLPEGLK